MAKIHVIEDDPIIYEELRILLGSKGYEVVTEGDCDLYLLDVGLPGKSGYDICSEIRRKQDTPIIFLTAKDTPQDELFAFTIGADDFVKKPYNPAVLLARIARLLKTDHTVCEKKGLRLNLSELKMSYGGREVSLTKNEALILSELMKEDVVSKISLIEKLWTNQLFIDENTLYVNINRLRSKLGEVGAKDLLTTIRGVGYKL